MRELKDSGVEWIGEIPSSWGIMRFKYFFDIVGGNGFKEEYQGEQEGDYPFFKASDINGPTKQVNTAKNYVTKERAIEERYNIIPANSILISKIGEALHKNHRKINLVDCIVDNNCEAFVLKTEDSIDYLYYIMLCIDMGWFDNGGTIPSVNNTKLKSFWLPYLPRKAQQEIAQYLDLKCFQIDSVIMKQQAVIEKLKEYKLSIITEKVSNGLNPCVSTKYSGNEFIGSIPSHWKCVKIKNVSIVVTDGAHVSPETENGVYDFISTVNVEQDHIDFDNCLKTTESSYQYLVSTGCRPLSGDVLISKDGSVGRTVIVNTDRDFVVSSSLVIIRPNIEMITSEYLNFILQSAFVQETLLMLMHGAGLRRVSVNKNANLPVLLPPIEEQKDIVKYLEKKCSDIEKDITKRRTIVEELFMYKKSIIFEAVTGKKEI